MPSTKSLGQSFAGFAPGKSLGPRAPAMPSMRLNRNDRLERLGRFGFLASAFFASYHTLRPWEFNFNTSDAFFFLGLFALGSQRHWTMAPFGSLTALWFGFFAMMMGGMLIGSINHGELSRWLLISVQYLVGWVLMPMFLMAQNKAFITRMILAYVAGTTIMQAFGALVVAIFTPGQAAKFLDKSFLAGNDRLGNFPGDGNWNGAMISFAVPMIVYLLIKKKLNPLIAMVMFAILGWAMLLSATNTGIIASALAAVIVLAVLGWRTLAKGVAAIVLMIGAYVMSGAPLPEVFMKRVGNAAVSGNLEDAGTFTDRTDQMLEAWNLSEQTIFIGIGADRYRDVTDYGNPVHNLYLMMLTEGSMISLIGLLGLLALMLAFVIPNLRAVRAEAATALAIILVFNVYATSLPSMYSRLWLFPLMLGLGLIFCHNGTAPAARKRQDLSLNSDQNLRT